MDLVGSTAFKAASAQDEEDVYPEWVNVFRQFYQNFPETLTASYRETKSALSADEPMVNGYPKIWKMIGDEIVFCSRIHNLQHLSCCITSFLSALHKYGAVLETSGHKLDVKGAAWIAIFPKGNRSISLQRETPNNLLDNGLITEDFEREVDDHPHRYDFLGTGIDTGFRIAKNAATDRLSISADLAFLLAKAAIENMFTGKFTYHGREAFKGVIENHLYPVISIDTERNAEKRTINARERMLTHEKETTALSLHDFLQAFLQHEKMELPVLPLVAADPNPPRPPASYGRFRTIWETGVKELNEREETVEESENPEHDADNSLQLSSAITAFAEQISKDVSRSPLSKLFINVSARHADLMPSFEKAKGSEANQSPKNNPSE